MLKRTPLFELHRAAGARMVDFGGWEMPLHYGSQIEEHRAVRNASGMFDVSHMRLIDLHESASLEFLQYLLANDVARLAPGKALYSCMLREDGGVLDDLIAYRMAQGEAPFRLVVNAATADTDLIWMRTLRERHAVRVKLQPRPDLALIAVQGPAARDRLAQAQGRLGATLASLRPFTAATVDDWFIARTGYTGEDGFEIALPAQAAPMLWSALAAAGVAPCGLGARDTLRLEAGMNLYGNDMDQTVSPLESGLAWTVDLRSARDFVGRGALEARQRDPDLRQLLGLKLLGAGVLRSHQEVQTSGGTGVITSGTFSPTMGVSIALARLPAGVAPGAMAQVHMRGGSAPALVCRPPFVRHGKVLV